MTQDLKKRMAELEDLVQSKDLEIQKYRSELFRVNEALERLVVELSHELKLAGLIQKALSPTQIPSIPGFEFSTKFLAGTQQGGDYFDIFEHDDRLKFGLILSSASGYSMSALLLSVLLKISGRMEAKKGIRPSEALALLQKEIMPNLQAKDSASLFYGVVDRRSFELQYSSLGKLASFHWQAATGDTPEKWIQLAPCGEALSPSTTGAFLDHQVQLSSRDRIVLCSEGVMHAKNAKGESFGMERLYSAVARSAKAGVHEVRNQILFQNEQFTGTVEPVRDQTVIVIEVNDRVIKLAK